MQKKHGVIRSLNLAILATLTMLITACGGGGGGGGGGANPADPGNQSTPQATIIKGKA